MLEELHLISGSAKLSGKVAYVEPEPIIFSDTIQNNIIFGKALDK
jgi:ABC-type multidrug transport system fused ATPase/permease subunit